MQCSMSEAGFDLIKSASSQRETVENEYPATTNADYKVSNSKDDCSRSPGEHLQVKSTTLDFSNSNEDEKNRHESDHYAMETEICFSPKSNKDAFAEICIDLNCSKSSGCLRRRQVDDACMKCFELDPKIAMPSESRLGALPDSNKPDCFVQDHKSWRSCNLDEIERTVMTLKNSIDEISGAISTQIGTRITEEKLMQEIQGMKCQLSELGGVLKSQMYVCPSQDQLTKSSSTLELLKNIEEIKCQLHQLTTAGGIGCASAQCFCLQCCSPCECLNSKTADRLLPVTEHQMASSRSESTILNSDAKFSRGSLNELEDLKPSMEERACDDYCTQFLTQKPEPEDIFCQRIADCPNQENSVERIFQILQELQCLLCTSTSFLEQNRVADLVCNLKCLLDSELNRPSEEDGALIELRGKHNRPTPYPSNLPPIVMDESAASVCGGATSNLVDIERKETINTKVKAILSDLYHELEPLDVETKARVASMLVEISSIIEAWRNCQPTLLPESVNIDTGFAAQIGFECNKEDLVNEELSAPFVVSPNLCCLLLQLQDCIKPLRPDAQFLECDFKANFSYVLNNLRCAVQTGCLDGLGALENIKEVLECLKAELCQQGTASAALVAEICMTEEMLTKARGARLPSEHCRVSEARSAVAAVHNDDTHDEKIAKILDSIEECFREIGIGYPPTEEVMRSQTNEPKLDCPDVKSPNASSLRCAEALSNKSPAIACAEKINLRVSQMLAELKNIAHTLEAEGCPLRDSTISKIFYIFGHIECILERDQQNACALMEIKQIIGRINGQNGQGKGQIGPAKSESTASGQTPPSTDSKVRGSNSGSQRSSTKTDSYIIRCRNMFKKSH